MFCAAKPIMTTTSKFACKIRCDVTDLDALQWTTRHSRYLTVSFAQRTQNICPITRPLGPCMRNCFCDFVSEQNWLFSYCVQYRDIFDRDMSSISLHLVFVFGTVCQKLIFLGLNDKFNEVLIINMFHDYDNAEVDQLHAKWIRWYTLCSDITDEL